MDTATSVEALKTSDLKDGEMKEVIVKGREILVARSRGIFYAVSNRCPHMGAKLSHGRLEGTIIICPRHGSQFDLQDGRVILWTKWTGVIASAVKFIKSPRPVQVYPVKVEGEKVLIEV